MSSNNLFPNEMLFDKDLTLEQLNLLKSQYKRFLDLRKEKMDINQYQLYLDRNKKPYFPKGTLIHGTSSSLDKLKKISETGILACEFLGMYEDGETFYCADFHRVVSDTLVSVYDSEFIPDGKTPFNKINNNIGLVINPTSKLGGLLYYDLLDGKFDNNPEVRSIINSLGIPRGFLSENRGKGSAILGGIPANAISGIIIGDKLVLDEVYVKEIQNLFPNSYIITRKGRIIKDRTNTITIDDYESVALSSAQADIKNDIINRDIDGLKKESERMQKDFNKYMTAVKDVVPPLYQAKVLLEIGYQSIPSGLLELLTDADLMELGIKNKNVKK